MTKAQRRNWYKFCSEPLDKIEHYEEALAEGFAGWCIHHRLEIQPDGTRVSMQELKDNGLYYDRPASELIFLRFGEHSSLHSAGNTNTKGKHHSAETRQKMSEALSGENHPFFGRHHSAETCKKMSKSRKGKHWWNDGVSCKLARECPGEGWKRGRLKASSSSLRNETALMEGL